VFFTTSDRSTFCSHSIIADSGVVTSRSYLTMQPKEGEGSGLVANILVEMLHRVVLVHVELPVKTLEELHSRQALEDKRLQHKRL